MKITDDVYGRTLNFGGGDEGEIPTEEEIVTAFEEMYGEDLVFDRLSENEKYVADLQSEYQREHGKKFEGDVSELIEEDFEYWNLIDNSIIAGGAETMLNFGDLSKEEKQRVMRRYDVYSRTNATGEGSRSFFEQLKGVGKAIALDMTIPGGIGGTLFKFGGKLAGKALTKPLLKKVLFPAISGAGWGAGTELGRQHREIELEARDELDPGAVQQSALIGGTLGPVAPAAIKGIGAGSRYVFRTGQAAFSKTKREAVKQAAQKKFADTLGGGPTAKKAVVEEAKEVLGAGDFEAGTARTQNILEQGFELVEKNFRRRFKNLGELDTSVSTLEKFVKNMKEDGVVSDNVNIILGEARVGNITATDALRKIRRELSNMAYAAKSSRDPATSSRSMLYDRWANRGREMFNQAAQRSGKAKQAADLDDAFSNWETFKKDASKLYKGHKDGEKIGRMTRELIAAPELSPKKIGALYSQINKLAKHADDPQMVDKVKRLVNMSLKEKLFENEGAKFIKMVKSTSGLKGLKLLFPKRAAEFDDYAKIMKNAGNSPAQFYWGRILAASAAGAAGGAAGGIAGGGLALGATMFMMNNALKSKAFRNMAMNAYRAGKPQPKVINGMVKWLNDKGMDGNAVRDYLLGAAVITGAAAMDDEGTMKEKAVEAAGYVTGE